MPATVIAERIEWQHGITILKERVAELRPLFKPPDPYQRTSYRPGELVQFDLWQPDVLIPLGHDEFDKLPALAMLSAGRPLVLFLCVRSVVLRFEELGGVAVAEGPAHRLQRLTVAASQREGRRRRCAHQTIASSALTSILRAIAA